MASTIEEIGRLVGCSSATVSRAMNRSGSVHPKTREAILRAVRETNYSAQPTGRRGRPSGAAARRLSRMVEILYFPETSAGPISLPAGGPDSDRFASTQDSGRSFYCRLIEGVSAELSKCGFEGVLRTITHANSHTFIADPNRLDCAGVLVIGQEASAMDRFVERCMHPLMLVNIVRPGRSDAVTTDNAAGIASAFDHLHEMGHRRIGFAGRQNDVLAFTERFTSFKWKLAEAGLPFTPAWVADGPNRLDVIEKSAARILALESRPTAMLCANDVAAFGVIRAANKAGLRVPADLSVVGFDDDESAAVVSPGLTTVRIPVTEIGCRSVRQLMLMIQNPATIGQVGAQIRLAPELIVRHSTAAPRAAWQAVSA
jgi:LacI family repressor for deo operon, udp, cdd, tsx, nupC, and nupG